MFFLDISEQVLFFSQYKSQLFAKANTDTQRIRKFIV